MEYSTTQITYQSFMYLLLISNLIIITEFNLPYIISYVAVKLKFNNIYYTKIGNNFIEIYNYKAIYGNLGQI